MANKIEAQVHLQSGNALYQQGNYIEAKKEYEMALASDPDNAEAHNGLGRVALMQQRYEEAEQFFRKASELNPKEPAYHSNLGLALQNLKRYEEAEKEFRAALDLNQDYHLAHRGLGRLFFEQKRYDEGRVEFEKALSLNPKDPEAHNDLGRVALMQQRYEEAEQFFRKASELNPKEPVYHSNLGLALQNLKRYEEAEKEFRAALDLNQDYDLAHRGLGELFFEQKRYNEAKVEFEKTLSINPKNPEAHNWLGRVALMQQRYEDAEQSFRKASELNPKEPVYPYNWGLILVNLKRHEEAFEKFGEAKRIDPDYAYAYHNTAHYLWRQGKYKKSWEEWEQARRAYEKGKQKAKSSRNADYFQYFGNILHEVFGDLNEAEEIYKEGLTLYPNHIGILTNLVNLYLEKKDEDVERKGMWKLIGGDVDVDKRAVAYAEAWSAYKKVEGLLNERLNKAKEPHTSLQLGELHLTMEEYTEAEKNLAPLERDLESAPLYADLGVLYSRKEDFKKAVQYFDEAVKRDPYDLRLRSNLAEAYLNANLKEKAEIEYKRILGITPNHVESQIGLGEVYIVIGDAGDVDMYDQAISHITEGMRIAQLRIGSKRLREKDLAAAYYSRGYARVKLYEASKIMRDESLLYEALEDFKNCFKNDSDHHKARRAKEKLEKRLSRFSPQGFVQKIGPWMISILSLSVFILSQFSFFLDKPKKIVAFNCEFLILKPITDTGYYVLLTFGSLIFMVAGLYLPQILKLKVGGIELEKSSVEQITTPTILGISK